MATATKRMDVRESVVIRFAGDSGDGMQTVGEQFTDSSALFGNDVSTFPDFPAEIRAPQGTLPGVSGFQVHFGSKRILTPGDAPEVLVAMNPAALKINLPDLLEKGILVVNTAAFTPENLKKAGYPQNPLDDPKLNEKFHVIKIDISQLTKDALNDSPLRPLEKSRCKNFFALGFAYWLYDRPLDYTLRWIDAKWKKRPDVAEANVKVLKAGYFYGETTESILSRYQLFKAPVVKGTYRKITGNEALVLGLIAGAERAGKGLVYGSYPITPASSIMEGLAKHKNFNVKTLQAEDEIAAIGIAIGAGFAGRLGVTATSGPGICLKSEAIGLAVMTEIPVIIIDVQRGGPSTGLPTKTEQADLLQVLFGRNSESPVAVLAAASPADCFNVAIDAVRIALTYRVPVILLSDGFLAHGSEPWKVPQVSDLPVIKSETAKPGEPYIPYKRDPETLARTLAIPGTPGLEHTIGGLEKNEAGGVSYDNENHERMVHLRAAKVAGIAKSFPPTRIHGEPKGKVLVLGWGGTYGTLTTAVEELQKEGAEVSSVHLRYLNPLPNDLGDILKNFDRVLIPELNLGQLRMLVRARYLIDALGFNKVQGRPFTVHEVKTKIQEVLSSR